jgi:hypothetical protein
MTKIRFHQNLQHLQIQAGGSITGGSYKQKEKSTSNKIKKFN